MLYHKKQTEVNTLLSHRVPIILTGEAGTGKSTILINAAAQAGVPYSFMIGTRQTTLGSIVGFINVNGIYVPSPFRKAYEEGHYFNIDEIDGMDSNVLLVFNSLDNGKIAFPDGYFEPPHKDFVLCATANPQNEHHRYTGRTKLDEATLDRFDIINIETDPKLERDILGTKLHVEINLMRRVLGEGSEITISSRDAIRYKKRKELGILEDYKKKLFTFEGEFYNNLLEDFEQKISGNSMTKEEHADEITTFEQLCTTLNLET